MKKEAKEILIYMCSLKIQDDLKEFYNNINEDLILKYSSSIINNICKKYNLDNVQRKILILNYDKLFNKYGFYLITIDDEISIKQDEMGITYTHMINEQGIKQLKLLVNDNMQLNITDYNYFCLKNNPIFYLDLKSYLTKFSNITIEDITKLGAYLNNFDMFNQYLELLNNCNEDIKDMIFEYIKPIIFYEEYEEEILKIFKLHNSVDLINLQKIFIHFDDSNQFMELLKQYIEKLQLKETVNIFNFDFLIEFNNYYINQYEQLYQISQKENVKQILQKLLNIKYQFLKSIPEASIKVSKKVIYKTVEEEVYDGNCWGNDRENGWYPSHTVSHKVIDRYEYTKKNNFNKKMIDEMKETLNLLLPMIIDEQYDYKKLLENNCHKYINLFFNCIDYVEKEKVLCK